MSKISVASATPINKLFPLSCFFPKSKKALIFSNKCTETALVGESNDYYNSNAFGKISCRNILLQLFGAISIKKTPDEIKNNFTFSVFQMTYIF